jgi:hypothetical protein
MLPLTGTTDAKHMLADLAVRELRLSEAEIAVVEKLG